MSSLSSPVLMAGESMPGSWAPRTYVLPPHAVARGRSVKSAKAKNRRAKAGVVKGSRMPPV